MNKKGISLIVLVITIIVMIIIAGAIILSLNNTNVTARANLATLVSDRANYQSLFATKIADKMDDKGQVDMSTITVTDLGINNAKETRGTWSIVGGEVIFTIKTDVDVQKTYGITADKLGVGSYSWLTK